MDSVGAILDQRGIRDMKVPHRGFASPVERLRCLRHIVEALEGLGVEPEAGVVPSIRTRVSGCVLV